MLALDAGNWQRWGGTIVHVDGNGNSSANNNNKGETLSDSIRCVECYVDTATVLRHPPVGQVVARPQMPSALLVFFCSQVSNLMNFLNGQFFHTNVQILHLGRYKGHFRFAVASIVVVVVVVTLLLLLGGQYSL